jgi:hypothetical protein
MAVTAAQIQEMASNSTVEVMLTSGRTLMIGAPEHVWVSPDGDLVALSGGAGAEMVDSDEIASVLVAVPDPDGVSRGRGPGVRLTPSAAQDHGLHGGSLPAAFYRAARAGGNRIAGGFARV